MLKIGVVVDNEFDHDHRVQKQVRLLQQEGHKVHVLCFDFGKNYHKYTSVDVTRLPIKKKIKDLLVLLSTNFGFYEVLWSSQIAKWINKNELDAIHAHDLYMSKSSYKGIQKSNKTVPLTLDLHENYPAAINSYQWAIKGWRKLIVQPKKWYTKEKEYLNYADTLIVLSNSFKENLLSRFTSLQAENIFVHPNMPDLESFKSFENNNLQVDFSSVTPTLFYFGVVAKRRGIIDLLPWIEKLLDEGHKFHTLIIGPTDKADVTTFNQHISNKILKNSVTYIPWADVKYLPAYLKKIQIGLAPFQVNAQHDSGVANKLFQYMYGEIPILATPCKAQKELIEQANCGLVYSNYEEFKNQLLQLINDTTLRNELGANGKKSLFQLYSEKADKHFLTIYNFRIE